ncbi:MAG: tRNA (N(6)-L-threonylcarbamoyladenosine(37)-C(2))-methylthiotransferase MtaB [Candidatus Aminicenantes bacterium]|jgi:threonylcarbamoyladenosine tRNA methylthiotransferase MtaB
MTSFSIQSFGCRVNQAEAFEWANEFQKKGYVYKKSHTKSDIILVNTCTVTSRADRDVRAFLRRIHRENPHAQLVLTGCYVERSPDKFKDDSQVLRLIPNSGKGTLPELLTPLDRPEEEISLEPFRSRALVKIQDGCDFRCTFCVVPNVRGPSVSVGRDRIIEQVKEYVNQGFEEIVLTGVHLCLYGRDSSQTPSLVELLEDLEEVEGLGRIRLSSIDPRFLRDDKLEYLTASSKICPHFHFSLQSGCDRILRQMGRKIRVVDYERVLDYVHNRLPHAALGADILVGFPEESAADFAETQNFLQRSPLTYYHVFTYSQRPGTQASALPQVSHREKTRRTRILRALSFQKNLGFRKRFLEEEMEAVVIKKIGEGARVLTANFIPVDVPFCPKEKKQRVKIKITEVSGDHTEGRVCEGPSKAFDGNVQ